MNFVTISLKFVRKEYNMKRTYIDIRDRNKSGQVVKTHIFRGDVSLIVVSMRQIEVIEMEKDARSTVISLEENHAFSVRNWGN